MHLRTPFYDRCPESQYRLQHFVCIQLFFAVPTLCGKTSRISPSGLLYPPGNKTGAGVSYPPAPKKDSFHMFHCFVTLKIKKILQSVSRRLRLPARSWPLPSHRVRWPWTSLSHGCRRRWQVLPSWNPKHGKYG